MELCRGDQLTAVQELVFDLIGKCLASPHFQVAERTLCFLTSEQLAMHMMSPARAPVYLPYFCGPLQAAKLHWNQTVESLATNTVKLFQDNDLSVYEKCVRASDALAAEEKQDRLMAAERWAALKLEAEKLGGGK